MRQKGKGKKLSSISSLCIISAILIAISCSKWPSGDAPSGNGMPEISQNSVINKDHIITVYYFHTDNRCPSCIKIERYTKEAVNKYFQEEVNSNKMVIRTINIEKPENRHFIQDYQLFTKTVVLVDAIKGKQQRWKRLDETWNYLRDRNAFAGYIKDEINAFIAEQG